jgi:hypothetical protein
MIYYMRCRRTTLLYMKTEANAEPYVNIRHGISTQLDCVQ